MEVLMAENPDEEKTNTNPDTNGAKGYFSDGWKTYILIGLGLGLALLLTVTLAHYSALSQAQTLTKEFELESKTSECKVITDTGKQNFINEQRKEIVAYANSHRAAAIKFYAYFYSIYAVWALFGLIAAISLAVITKKGVEAADNRLIAVFLVSTGIVVLYQGFFGVFQHSGNIDVNAKLYVSYARLVNQIDTYCTTGKVNVKDPLPAFAESLPKNPKPTATNSNTSNSNASNTNSAIATPKPTESPAAASGKVSPFYVALDPDEFINYIDWQIEAYKNITIATVDATKIAAIDKGKVVLP
jgi:hypothetical protein